MPTNPQEKKCSCGEPHISDRIQHCYDGKPCYSYIKDYTPSTAERTGDDYNHVSHTHCWDNKENPCGIPIDKHTQCCLCDLKPTSPPEDWEKEWDDDYGNEPIEIQAVGIIAAALTHARTKDFGADASYLTKKLMKVIRSEREKAYEAGREGMELLK